MFNLARIAVQRGRHGSLATIKTGLASTKFQLLHPRFQTTGGTAGNTFKTGQFVDNTETGGLQEFNSVSSFNWPV